MKIALLNDTHFGCRNDSPAFMAYHNRFYDEIFLSITDTPFDQNRLYAALGYKFNASVAVQAGYLRHRLGSQKLNRFQLGVFLNTKRKVKEKVKMNS